MTMKMKLWIWKHHFKSKGGYFMKIHFETNVISGIFEIRNIMTNQVYIGGSETNINTMQTTYFTHLSNNTFSNKYLQDSYNYYGRKNFKFKILEICEPKDLLSLKKKWVKKTKSNDRRYGFNIARG